MKQISLLLGFCILGFVAVELFLHFQHQVVQKKVEEQKKLTGFSLERAPNNTLRGEVATLSGEVRWQSRVATQPAQLKQLRSIQQGEELWTGKDGNVVVQLKGGPSITLLPNTHVNFIQTLPSSIVLKQDQGTIVYKSIAPTNISVTSLDLLTTMQQGEMTVHVDTTQNTVSTTVSSGGVTEAYNDTDNTTSVNSVVAGKTFIFDDASLTSTVK